MRRNTSFNPCDNCGGPARTVDTGASRRAGRMRRRRRRRCEVCEHRATTYEVTAEELADLEGFYKWFDAAERTMFPPTPRHRR